MVDNKKSRRSTEIVEQLREEILSGQLTEGSRLTEIDVSKRFKLGRNAIREAFQKLTHQGLLVTRPNRGVVVASEPPKPIRDLIVPIRQMLEGYVLELIFDELNDEDFARWEDLLTRMKEACATKDYAAIAEADIAFHRSILERAGQPDLLAIWEAMVYRIRSHFRRTQRRCPDPMGIYDEHRAIVDSIRSGDLQATLALLNEKIE
ncbi:GntR family transcriptional regulator [Blastopirellula sp. J2-11]|uniref:GntR family transcriptional regulator n=1 Tax=Blastopirellula sp. J2-11 TaxID=2943192 RepID=UPI0021CA64EC|nr:GntR family transcriptional regulator [Blastopirellula sp. J2-11]UUO04396.1 GntR family transcriptional regulator [Blastopirellula sp. J2-11]